MHVVASMTYYAFAAGIPLLLLSGIMLSHLNRSWPGLVDLVAQTPLGELPFVGHRLHGYPDSSAAACMAVRWAGWSACWGLCTEESG